MTTIRTIVVAIAALASPILLSTPASATVHRFSAPPLPESAFAPLSGGGETAPNATSSDCLTGYTCWYGDSNYAGWIQRYSDVQTANIAYPDQMSSWINRNSHAAAWFTGSGGTGTGHCMKTNSAVSQVLPNENDTMVSFKIYSAASC